MSDSTKNDQPEHTGRADYADRQERRRERLEDRADRASAEASSRFQTARASIEMIPFGQPILVGHHSESRHRGALAKHDRNMRAGIDAGKRAEQLASRAESVGTAGISSDDPEAVQKLQGELDAEIQAHARMKAANAIIRKHGKNPDACLPLLIAAGFTESLARKALTPDCFNSLGFPSYALAYSTKNQKRIRDRIEQLRAVAKIEDGERARSQSGVVFQVGENRVQLMFPGKPADDIRARLKREGFRWAPSAGAWQRNLNNAGIYAAGAFIKWLDQEGR